MAKPKVTSTTPNKGQKEPNVRVHHAKDGCPIDGRRDEHAHTQRNWRRAVDRAGRGA